MSYQLNKIHLIICILAALSITIGFIIRMVVGVPFGLFTMAFLVSCTIVVFYCLGHIARSFLISQVFPPPPEGELELLADEMELISEADTDTLMMEPMQESNFTDFADSAEDSFMDADDDFNDSMLDDTMLEPLAVGEQYN